jgi:glutamate racemase
MAGKNDFAIGVFDSGLGGLTVVKELVRRLPNENIVYYGDTARVPYGSKSKETIVRFSLENVRVLLKNNVKLIVVACNSCSSYAMGTLKSKFKVPIIGVLVPGARKAAQVTAGNRIAVIATAATIASGKYPKAVMQFNKKARVVGQPCPLFVPLVEEGWHNRSIAAQVAKDYLKKVKRFRADTLILGCTHYPLLKRTLQRIVGPNVRLIDSAQVVANEAKRRLQAEGLTNRRKTKGRLTFLVSDKPQSFKRIARNFLGFDLGRVKQVKEN